MEAQAALANLAKEPDLSLDDDDYNQVLKSLVTLTRYCQDSDNRAMLNSTTFKSIGTILAALMESDLSRDDVFVEAFRFLRNSVVACKRNQDVIREGSIIFEVTQHFLQAACRSRGKLDTEELDDEDMIPAPVQKPEHLEDKLSAIRSALQFLANCMVKNMENTDAVITLFLEKLSGILNAFYDDGKIVEYTAMIMHLAFKRSTAGLSVTPTIIQCFLKNLHLEFAVYAMESLISLENFTDIYENLEPDARIRMLNFFNARTDLIHILNEKIITKIKVHFIEKSDFILRSKIDDRDNTFCWEIAALLETLCSVSLSEKAEYLKSDQVFLITVLCLLKQIHETGKTNQGEGNVFSPVEDLGKLTSKSTTKTDLDDIRAHPTFQFKAHLIRLIGNLAHRDSANQNKVRELECLPIILDSCKIDARNPFIAQWSVLALRNLCEGNDDNQAYIREVQRVDTENLIPKLELVNLSN